MYRYVPYIGANGRGADYQAFRMDTAHRVTLPFKIWDVLSVVPRVGYRGTYWSDSGDRDAAYLKASGDGLFRHIGEIGFTASARGSAWLSDSWRHTVEPYLDYSYQAVDLSAGSRQRYYAFDSYDRSIDWLDQFGFEGRGLPYNWHGVRPGIRNTFQELTEGGLLRTVLDWDLYAAIPFETMTPYGRDNLLAGYPNDDRDGNYNRSGHHQVVPGTRIRWNPSRDISLLARAEYDCQNSKAAYADIAFRQRLTDTFSYNVSYIGRDQRLWTYLPSAYDRWNYQFSNVLQLGFTHDVCDVFAWSPYIRYDCRRDEVDEVGAWFDLLTDCLGYRVLFAHETSYTRIDNHASAYGARRANSANGAERSTSLMSTQPPFAASAPRRTAAPFPRFGSMRRTTRRFPSPGTAASSRTSDPSSTRIVSTSSNPLPRAAASSSGIRATSARARSGAL